MSNDECRKNSESRMSNDERMTNDECRSLKPPTSPCSRFGLRQPFDTSPSTFIRHSTFDIPESPLSTAEWQIIVSVVLAALLAFGPWMLMVHGKLAVLVAKLAELCEKIEKVAEAQQRLWEQAAEHTARLDRHEIQLDYLDQRLREME